MSKKRDRKSKAVEITKQELAALKGSSSMGSEVFNAMEESGQGEESVQDLESVQSFEVSLLSQLLALQ